VIKSKLPNVGTTIFTVMSKLAVETGALNLGQGFPGFPMDMKLGKLVEKYISKGMNQYAPMQGVQELRNIISKKIERMYGHTYDPDLEITITAGGTQAIFTAITAIIHEGDEVILFSPAYDCYSPAVELNGGKSVWVDLHYPEYKVNWDHVRKLINHKTKLIILNSPHNPSGTCLSEADMMQLEKLVSGSDIVVLSDEVYEHIVFDGEAHQSVARYPNLTKQSFAVYSFGKTFHNTGWKMGYICGPAEMMKEFRKVHQFNVFSCNTPVQFALAEYMQDESTYLSLPNFYEAKRNLFLESIKDSAFKIVPSKGTYFQLLSYDGLFNEKDSDLAIRLTKEFGIASIPCSVFYPDHLDEKVLRFCFAKEDDVLLKAGEILSRIGK
jgi:methionine aminotransferase